MKAIFSILMVQIDSGKLTASHFINFGADVKRKSLKSLNDLNFDNHYF
jgi:hypothetical protein